MEVGLTPEAADYISERGGRLYLWQQAAGADWTTDHLNFEDPSREVPFTPISVAGVVVMLADDLERPKTLRIRLDRIPRRIHVEWDGVRWGHRGVVLGVPTSF